MKKVMIVDDHPVARLAVKMIIEKERLEIVAESDDGLQAIKLVKQFSPDLLIIDIDIPTLNGIDAVQRLRKDGFSGGILVLSGKDGDHYIRRCASAGADGFISKRHDLNELHDALRAIRGGYGYFPAKRLLQSQILGEGNSETNKIAGLSPKELDVLRYLARGMKVVEIAQIMNISDKTVSTYKSRLMVKLGLNNMVEVFDFTQRHNLD